MDDYLSEREQVDALKGAVKQNAPWALTGILIGVAALLGYQQWNAWLDRQAFTASQKYSAVVESLSRRDGAAAAKLVDELKSGYARTPYPELAELVLARFYVESGKLEDASKLLSHVMDSARDAEVRPVAGIRLARVQRALRQPDAALATLAKLGSGAAAPAVADVRGDVLLDKGDKAGARAAWNEALAAKTPGLVDRELVELKIAALGLPAPAGGDKAP